MDLEISENSAVDEVANSDLVKDDVEFHKPTQLDNAGVATTDNAEKDLEKIKAKAAFKFKKLEIDEIRRFVYRDALKTIKSHGGAYPLY